MLRELKEAARTSQVPMVIFPEGTRTKDGEIGEFMTTGLRLILRSRSWKVFVFVVDGYAAKSGDPKANGKDITMADGRNFFLGVDNPGGGAR